MEKRCENKIRTDNSAVIANLQAENERLRKALRFYADYTGEFPMMDCGETAREALKEGED